MPTLYVGCKIECGFDQFIITKLGVDRFDLKVTKSDVYMKNTIYTDQIISSFFHPGSEWMVCSSRRCNLPEWI